MKQRHLFLLGIFISTILGALPAYAQGPVQPEAMQFEPVDVTDVVNLATGDFVYTIPVMSVPGPAGDYPIVLSYHSGIGPNQPATWVGLGWTLNAGAINRTLSGYPDDYNGDQVVTHHEGDQSSWAIQLGVGWGPIGLNMNYDHESGKVGVNMILSVSTSMLKKFGNAKISANLSGSFGVYGNRGSSFSGGASAASRLSKNSLNSYKLGISAGANGVGVNGGVSTSIYQNANKGNSISLISTGATISSSGTDPSFSIGGSGFSSMTSASQGVMSVSSFSGNIPLPGSVNISFGFSKWKWKLDETISERAYGSLYKHYWDSDLSLSNNYSRVNERQLVNNVTVPSKDAFNVSVQGVSGVFTSVDEYVYRLIDHEDQEEKGLIYPAPGWSQKNTTPNFRFLGDQGYNFVNISSGENFGDNYDLLDDIEYSGKKIEPIFSTNGKITGFTIIKTDGMIYEFKIPINTYYQFSKTWSNEANNYENWSSLGGKFANTWLLTAIKGPDYVDRGITGITDDDWGYWVKFSYTKEPELQLWRAPFEGRAAVGDDSAEQLSFGINEKYYLSEIETKTHKAEFLTSLSETGVPPNDDVFNESNVFGALFQPSVSSESPLYSYQGYFDFIYDGDYRWVSSLPYTDQLFQLKDFVRDHGNSSHPSCINTYISSNGVSIIQYNSSADETKVRVNFNHVCASNYSVVGRFQLQNAVEDHTDVNSRDRKLDRVQLVHKLSGSIISASEFEYDYVLRGNSNGSNSGNHSGVINGALTLMKVQMLGLNDTPVSPPYRFHYPTGLYNPDYNADDIDQWGSFRYNDGDRDPRVRSSHRNQEKADFASAWNMTGVTTPTGSRIDVDYESDDFFFLNGTLNLKDASEMNILGSWNKGSTQLNVTNIPSDLPTGEHSVFILHNFWWKMEGNPPPYQPCSLFDPDGNHLFETENSSRSYTNRVDVTSRSFGTLNLKEPINFFHQPNCYYTDGSFYIDIRNTYEIVYAPPKTFGGGTRVKAITSRDGSTKLKTIYTYLDGTLSSGTTPSISNPTEDPITAPGISTKPEDYESIYMESEKSFNRPAPSVVYSKVQVMNVEEFNEPVSGMTQYEFYTSNDHPYRAVMYEGSITNEGNLIQVKDKSGIYGMPKASTYYEQISINNEIIFRPISKTETNYAFSTELNTHANVIKNDHSVVTGTLGIVQEKHMSKVETSSHTYKANIDVQRLNVYNIGQSSTEYYYNDTYTTTPSSTLVTIGKTIGFDMYTGQPLVSVSQTESSDETLITQITPAWWVYSSMLDKNMLTQGFQNTTYRTNISINNTYDLLNYTFANNDILSSEVTTWDQFGKENIWRQSDAFTYNIKHPYSEFPTSWRRASSRSYPFTDVQFPTANEITPWEMTKNIITYNDYGKVIETVNKDGTYNSVLIDNSNHTLVQAVATNAKLSEIKYFNFEIETPNRHARTGIAGTTLSALSSLPSSEYPSATPSFGGKYKVGLWVKASGNYTVNGISYVGNNTWQFIITKLALNETIHSSGMASVDDVTIIPEYASISYFSYDPTTWKVKAMTGPDHRTTFYEYDNSGRLVLTKDFEGNILSKIDYGYADDIYISATNSKVEVNQSVTFYPILVNNNSTINEYKWTFGDGTIIQNSTAAPVSNTFVTVGEYPVVLTTIDNDGKTKRTIYEVEVIPQNNAITNLTLTHSSLQVSANKRLITLFAEHGGVAVDYEWAYRATGQNTYTIVSGIGNSGTSPSFALSAGAYTFRVIAEDSTGNTTTETIRVTIN